MSEFKAAARRWVKEYDEKLGRAEGALRVETAKQVRHSEGKEVKEEEEEEEEDEEEEEQEEEERGDKKRDAPPPYYSNLVGPPVLQGKVVEAPRGLANPNAATLFLKADKTSPDATFAEALVDRTVQFGQPYPAVTHCETWVGERAGHPDDDNHYSTYLGAKKGAMWTSALADSRRFYGCSNPMHEDNTRRTEHSSWSAIPIFAVDGAQKLRSACSLHVGTPYPPSFLLWQYPMSVWPLRAFSGLLDDRINTPAHCAALSARILRSTFLDIELTHPSHWYGPSSLYLELAAPLRMEKTLAHERPGQMTTDEQNELNELADVLVQHSDDDVVDMEPTDALKALHTLAIHVLQAGSRVEGDEVDQDEFREAQERYARGLCRYTWTYRKGLKK